MKRSLLTYTQAEAVARAALVLAEAGARPSRIVLPVVDDLHLAVRYHSGGNIVVRLVDAEGRCLTARSYASFERFVAEHAEAA